MLPGSSHQELELYLESWRISKRGCSNWKALPRKRSAMQLRVWQMAKVVSRRGSCICNYPRGQSVCHRTTAHPMSSNDHPMSSHTSYHWPSTSCVWTNNRSPVVLQCIARITLPPGRTTSLIVMDDGLSQNQISVRMSLNVQNIFVCKCIGINDWLSMPIVSRWS